MISLLFLSTQDNELFSPEDPNLVPTSLIARPSLPPVFDRLQHPKMEGEVLRFLTT